VLIPNDFGAAELSSREERAAFDLGLMSRCEKIIAGTSAFTRAAAMYGNVPIMDVLRYAQRATIHSAILEDLSTPGAHYAPLDRAKSLQWIALRLQEVLSAKERDALLQGAGELDPDNLSYWHLRAVDRLRLQKPDEAETMLLEAARLHAAKTAGAALSLTPSFEVLADHSDELAPHAGDPRYPFINAFYAAHLQNIGDFDGAERCLRTATENSDLPLLRALYADHLVARGRHADARGVIRPVIENGLELPIANYVYGRALKTRPGAYVQFKQAYELAPHVPLFASTWAYYAMQCGEQEKGRQIVEELVKSPTLDADVAALISKTFERLNDKRSLDYAILATRLKPRHRRYRVLLERLKASEPEADGPQTP
jgi:predicted Zn-dependent protease